MKLSKTLDKGSREYHYSRYQEKHKRNEKTFEQYLLEQKQKLIKRIEAENKNKSTIN